MKPNYKNYILAFIYTFAIFLFAFYVSNFIGGLRANDIKTIQEDIAIDILSNETQFDLLKEVSCEHVDNSYLAPQLKEIGEKLEKTENDLGGDNDQVEKLRRYYSLLQIKDYLLSKQLAQKCTDKKPVFIMYFYTKADLCPDCTKMGWVLTSLREKYEDLRVYSFDISTDLSAIAALKTIYKIKDTELPTIVLNDKAYTGFKDTEDIEALLPEAFKKKYLEDQKKKQFELKKEASSTIP